ncbi:MAG: Uma2 family endonuclease [Cyanobacteria bacterium]|nr:Uma2 family endonuclease [Cyanobacteriota bacterium]
MTLASNPAPPSSTEASFATSPLFFPKELQLTPEQFQLVCAANPNAVLELDAQGHLISMTPTGGDTGSRNSRLLMRLLLWADRTGGWKVFDSSTGFRLPDGSVLSPDASLVSLERWQALNPEQRSGFPPFCPDLVVELASPSDEGPRGVSALRRKMAGYQTNGAQLGWLLLLQEQAVEVWTGRQSDGPLPEPQRLEGVSELYGGMVLPGLVLDLEEIWRG